MSVEEQIVYRVYLLTFFFFVFYYNINVAFLVTNSDVVFVFEQYNHMKSKLKVWYFASHIN